MFVKAKDTVVVISGQDKGKQGKVLTAYPKANRVIVEGVAMVKKHQKPRMQGQPGGIIEKEAAIDASNVMLYCAKCNAGRRFGRKVTVTEKDGKKVRTVTRVCKKCGTELE
ncbi:MAG: 50S ribosomal protein L24 [Clostridia bacterium]|nr:50S ribosomal protein L24 [Clostridia bacterium]